MSPPFVKMIAFMILASYTSNFAACADNFDSYKNGLTQIFEEYGKSFNANVADFFNSCVNENERKTESVLIHCIGYAVNKSTYIMKHFSQAQGETNEAKYLNVIFRSLDGVHEAGLQQVFNSCMSLDIPGMSADVNVLRCVVVVAEKLKKYTENIYPGVTFIAFVGMVRTNVENLFSKLQSDYPSRQFKGFFDECMSRPYSADEKDDHHLLRCINQGIVAFMDEN